MFREIGLDTTQFDWSQTDVGASLRAIVAIAVCLGVGILLGHPREGMNGAYGAMSVAFGSFQKDRAASHAARYAASFLMAISILVGGLVGHSMVASILAVAVWGFWSGLLIALSTASAWIGIQAAIALFLAIAYAPSGPNEWMRAGFVLGGGLLQTLLLYLFSWMEKPRVPRVWRMAMTALDEQLTLDRLRDAVKADLHLNSPNFRFALRVAFALAVAQGLSHFMGLQNGYWVPMTALLVMKPDFSASYSRAFARMSGTLAGAIVATLIAAELRPSLWMLAGLVIVFAWLCYNLVRVNYAIYTICITSYVVFLLALAGLPAHAVVLHRIANTLIGGAIGLTTRTIYRHWESRRVRH